MLAQMETSGKPAIVAADQGPADAPSAHVRRCLACNYDLRGLGVEPRCPECGLINIPEALRRQVWELVDSGKRFFSGPLQLFRKRLPGWWWALDRPGDLGRSFNVAAENVLIAGIIALLLGTALCSLAVDTNRNITYLDDEGKAIETVDVGFTAWIGGRIERRFKHPSYRRIPSNAVDSRISDSNSVVFRPSLHATRGLLALFFGWLVWIWVIPALVGIWTQIRRGLPNFARAPRTIIAAANYESHRLIYVAVLGPILGIVLLPSLTSRVGRIGRYSIESVIVTAFMVLALYAGLGWVGPLRSDGMRQLVRSTFHLWRIVVIYAIAFPALILLASYAVLRFGWF